MTETIIYEEYTLPEIMEKAYKKVNEGDMIFISEVNVWYVKNTGTFKGYCIFSSINDLP